MKNNFNYIDYEKVFNDGSSGKYGTYRLRE